MPSSSKAGTCFDVPDDFRGDFLLGCLGSGSSYVGSNLSFVSEGVSVSEGVEGAEEVVV